MIHSLPQSLIDTAHNLMMQRNGRVVESHITSLHYPATSLHCNHRNDICPLSFFSINEGLSAFHDWAIETEYRTVKLPIDAYLGNDNESDNIQIANRGMIQMSHPQLFQTHFSGLSDQERKTVHDHIHIGLRQTPQYSSGSAKINQQLLGAYKSQLTPNPYIKHPNGETFDLSTMDKALDKSKLKSHLITYSGIGFNPEDHMNEYGILASPTFLSTSTRRFTAGKYAIIHGYNVHHMLQIHNDVNDSGIYVGNRTPLSKFSDDEYILPRNTMLKVTDHVDYSHNTHTFRIWNTIRHDKNKIYEESAQ